MTITNKNPHHLLPKRKRETLLPSISALDTQGRVIISSLPDGPAPGADLFAPLSPVDRSVFVREQERTEESRFFFCCRDGCHLLYTGLAVSHEMIFSVNLDAASAFSLRQSARLYGLEELFCSGEEGSDAVPPRTEAKNMTSVGLSLLTELDRVFSSGSLPLASTKEAERFFLGFTRPSQVGVSVERVPSEACSFDGVSVKTVGLTVFLIAATVGCLFGADHLRIDFPPPDGRDAPRIELAVAEDSLPVTEDGLTHLYRMETQIGNFFGLKCKSFRVEYRSGPPVFSFSPTVFDPSAEGIMQEEPLGRSAPGKGRKK